MRKYTPEWWQNLRPEAVGHEVEILVEREFQIMNTRKDFAWHRLPDAKAARGRMAAQPADYIYRSDPYSGYIEVKALKHPYRLPSARVTQLPTLHKWALAGATNFILVFHYMDQKWRIVNSALLEFGVPSWDLSEYEAYGTPREALLSTWVFK